MCLCVLPFSFRCSLGVLRLVQRQAHNILCNIFAVCLCFVVGYSTLRGWPLAMSPVEDPRVIAVAEKVKRTPSQVLLRWALQSGLAVIPRSRNPLHVAENSKILEFELNAHDMRTITALETLVNSPVSKPRYQTDPFGLLQ